MKNNSHLKVGIFTALTALSLGVSQSAVAGYGTSLMQTANVLPKEQYEAKIQNDIIFKGDGGYNISAHFLAGLIDPFIDLDFYLGTGTTDFQIGALGKINLLPDLPEQIGLALNFGTSYLRDESTNYLLLTFSILGSKEFLTNFGTLTPYSAFQFEGVVQSGEDGSRVPLTLVIGSKAKFTEIDYPFYGEIGISLHEANTYLALGVSHNF